MNFSKIEKKWQKIWQEKGIYEPDLKRARNPFYNLMMFPYPSAEGLHVGNVYAFAGSDIYGRFKRMNQYDVFEPVGLDGFGIHSENYALKIGKHPMKQAKISEKRFYKQLEAIGNGFAWESRLETYDSEYYHWTQWIFIQLFKKKMAYRRKQAVNWCPSCKTVLSDEQVIDGKCERCSSGVEKKELEQWFFRITDYAEKLLNNLDNLDWSEKVKIAQKNWIGKSEGALIDFSIEDSNFIIQVFTTRPDTLFGATYIVLAPENEFIARNQSQIINYKEVENYIKKTAKKNEAERMAEGREKTGIELKGVKAINPATKEKIPVWIADYVLAGYGTGAIMAVPAHDERDFEFAKKYGLLIKEVVVPYRIDKRNPPVSRKKTVERKNVQALVRNPKNNKFLCLKSKKFFWVTFPMGGIEENENVVEAARREVEEETGYTNLKLVRILGGEVRAEYFAKHKNENRVAYTTGVLFDLIGEEKNEVDREWENSHEIMWIDKDKMNYDTMVHAEMDVWIQRLKNNESAYVNDGALINSGQFTGMVSKKAREEIVKWLEKNKSGGKVVNYKLRDWIISRQRYWGPPIPMIYCEKCGWQPVPEKDLPVKLPFIKNFRPLGKGESPLASIESFYKTKCPKCGSSARRETDVSDTFLDSAWYYLRYPSVKERKFLCNKSISKKWLPVDMYIGGVEHAVLHLLYVRFIAMFLHDLGVINFEEPFKKFRAHGLLIKEGSKMSKSKGNVVVPDEYIKKFGADTLRIYLMFLAPFEQGGDFRDAGILGVKRFLDRIYKLVSSIKYPASKKENEELKRLLHQTIKKVTEDIGNLRFNTAISALMILLNKMEENYQQCNNKTIEQFLKLLAPFAPHLSEELWQQFFRNPKSEILNSKQIQNSKFKISKRFRSIHQEEWPKYNIKLIQEKNFELIIQINGKTRDKILVNSGIFRKEAEKEAMSLNKIKILIAGKEIKKVIFVPDKLINFVV